MSAYKCSDTNGWYTDTENEERERMKMDGPDDDQLRGGNLWELPSRIVVMVSLSASTSDPLYQGPSRMMLISDPRQSGSGAVTLPDDQGFCRWLWTLPELKAMAQRGGWRHLGRLEARGAIMT